MNRRRRATRSRTAPRKAVIRRPKVTKVLRKVKIQKAERQKLRQSTGKVSRGIVVKRPAPEVLRRRRARPRLTYKQAREKSQEILDALQEQYEAGDLPRKMYRKAVEQARKIVESPYAVVDTEFRYYDKRKGKHRKRIKEGELYRYDAKSVEVRKVYKDWRTGDVISQKSARMRQSAAMRKNVIDAIASREKVSKKQAKLLYKQARAYGASLYDLYDAYIGWSSP